MMIKSVVAFVTAITGFKLGASATPNPVCMKLPELKGLSENTTCCDFPALLEPKTMEECWKQAASTTDSDSIKHCKSLECLFKQHNMLKADGTFDKAAAEKYLDEQLKGNGEWLKVVKPIVVDQCLVAVDNEYDKMVQFFKTNKMDVSESDKCALKPLLVSVCVSAKAFAKCPIKSWNQSPSCDEWKKYMIGCSDNIENTLQFYKQLDASA